MDAGDPRQLAEPLDDVDGDLDAGRLRLVALEPVHAGEGRAVDLDAGDVVVHVPEHPRRARRRDAGKNRRAPGNAGGDDRFEPLGEAVDVVDDVRLEEPGTGGDLLLEPIDGVEERICRARDEEAGRLPEGLAGG